MQPIPFFEQEQEQKSARKDTVEDTDKKLKGKALK